MLSFDLYLPDKAGPQGAPVMRPPSGRAFSAASHRQKDMVAASNQYHGSHVAFLLELGTIIVASTSGTDAAEA